MSMRARRTAMLATGGALLLASGAASAQVDPAVAANILVECAKIGDATARLACFDNNIGRLDPNALRSLPPRAAASPGAAPPPQAGPQGFGAESVRVRQESPSQSRPAAEQQVEAMVASVREGEPGIYLVTLRDGAQWQFAESAGPGYRPPREGQTVEIERGALGNFLMRIDRQQPVSVRRVR